MKELSILIIVVISIISCGRDKYQKIQAFKLTPKVIDLGLEKIPPVFFSSTRVFILRINPKERYFGDEYLNYMATDLDTVGLDDPEAAQGAYIIFDESGKVYYNSVSAPEINSKRKIVIGQNIDVCHVDSCSSMIGRYFINPLDSSNIEITMEFQSRRMKKLKKNPVPHVYVLGQYVDTPSVYRPLVELKTLSMYKKYTSVRNTFRGIPNHKKYDLDTILDPKLIFMEYLPAPSVILNTNSCKDVEHFDE